MSILHFHEFHLPCIFQFFTMSNISPRYPPHIPHIHIHPKTNLSRYLDTWNGCFWRNFWLDVLNVLLTKKTRKFCNIPCSTSIDFHGIPPYSTWIHVDFRRRVQKPLHLGDDFKAISDPHAWWDVDLKSVAPFKLLTHMQVQRLRCEPVDFLFRGGQN